jgi:hypothetical protein
LNQEGQITERFTRAIDQLGSGQLEIRIGGIYALERIARDSQRDYGSIVEILTAYVRQRAPWEPEMGKNGIKNKLVLNDHLAPDIQAAMVVLGRRRIPEKPLLELNLSYTDLAHGNFYSGQFEGTIFVGSNLQFASFNGANLRSAYLISADCTDSFFEETNLRHAKLGNGLFTGASFQRSDLSGANFSKANLVGALFEGAILHGADLSEALIQEKQLKDVKTDKATLWPRSYVDP